ncbi:MAG TPA: hypothetical protein DCL61_31950 [Cyanobacteria bacterium UBA12227]|nr:hypothetical protein [Cyanobacteria bacterium UBA12227]HAX85223.1 hypothetical protein [Cyanobacteria bacterium UBA11370]HBY76420.1 hypothetical protein [Cyanobacteria bacterium UBA11148]
MFFKWLGKINADVDLGSFSLKEVGRRYLYRIKRGIRRALQQPIEQVNKKIVRHRNTIHILLPIARETISSPLYIRWMSMVDLDANLVGWVYVWSADDDQLIQQAKFQRTSPFKVPFQLEDGDYTIQIVFRGNGVIYSSRKVPITIVAQSKIGIPLSPGTETQRIYCPAPWLKMNVGKFHANPCCNLKRRVRIPFNPEIEGYDPWNSPAMVELRQALINGDSRFCHEGCPMLKVRTKEAGIDRFKGYKKFKLELFGSIDEERSYSQSLEEFLEGKTILESQPLSIKMALNHFCNHACVFCARDIRSSWRADKSMWELLEKYFKGLYSVSFSGGEPLIFFEAAEEQLAKISDSIKDVHFEITTNGSLLLKCAPFLSKLEQLSLIVSFNAGTPETYARVHRKDHFERVCQGIQKVQEMRAGKLTRIRMKMILMKSTFREIPDFAKVAANLGADEVKFTSVLLYKDSDIDESEVLSLSDPEWFEAEQLLNNACQYLKERAIPMRVVKPGNKRDDFITVSKGVFDDFGERDIDEDMM